MHLNQTLSREELLRALKNEGFLRSEIVEDALRSIPREEFLWSGTPRIEAYFDEPLSLGKTGQTISAPHMVAVMLETLDLSPGLRVLEVGTGSGYNAALLGHIVSKGGKEKASEPLVFSIERNHDLVEFARKNIEKLGLERIVHIIEGDGSLGYPERSQEPIYDRIIVTAGAPRVPSFLRKQLKLGGIMEIPVANDGYQKLLKLRKTKSKKPTLRDELSQEAIIDCMFVPLVGEDAYKN